jgi:hypothetical protein
VYSRCFNLIYCFECVLPDLTFSDACCCFFFHDVRGNQILGLYVLPVVRDAATARLAKHANIFGAFHRAVVSQQKTASTYSFPDQSMLKPIVVDGPAYSLSSLLPEQHDSPTVFTIRL